MQCCELYLPAQKLDYLANFLLVFCLGRISKSELYLCQPHVVLPWELGAIHPVKDEADGEEPLKPQSYPLGRRIDFVDLVCLSEGTHWLVFYCQLEELLEATFVNILLSRCAEMSDSQ